MASPELDTRNTDRRWRSRLCRNERFHSMSCTFRTWESQHWKVFSISLGVYNNYIAPEDLHVKVVPLIVVNVDVICRVDVPDDKSLETLMILFVSLVRHICFVHLELTWFSIFVWYSEEKDLSISQNLKMNLIEFRYIWSYYHELWRNVQARHRVWSRRPLTKMWWTSPNCHGHVE